jgi:hypothetical protein
VLCDDSTFRLFDARLDPSMAAVCEGALGKESCCPRARLLRVCKATKTTVLMTSNIKRTKGEHPRLTTPGAIAGIVR